MDSVQLQNLNNIYQTAAIKKTNAVTAVQSTQSGNVQAPAFNAQAYTTAVTIRTSLANKDERKMYEDLSNELELPYRKKLEFALKSGQLLKNNSNFDEQGGASTLLFKLIHKNYQNCNIRE